MKTEFQGRANQYKEELDELRRTHDRVGFCQIVGS